MKLLDRYYHLLAAIAPGSAMARSRVLYRSLYEIPYTRWRKPAIGLFEPDAVLGWRNRREITSVHPSFEYRVTYRTDAEGCRVRAQAESDPEVLFLGCSWTFGHGVEDDQTYPYLAESRFGRPCRSLAVMGYGPTQAYLLLARGGWAQRVVKDSEVIYCWIPEQLMRAWRRRAWIALNSWVNPQGASHPVLDFENGRLHDRGLVGLTGAIEVPARAVSGEPDLVERMEWRVTVELMAGMAELVAARGARLRVMLPPLPERRRDHELAQEFRRLVNARGLALLDLESVYAADPPVPRHRLFYRFDGHPTPVWHSVVAELFATRMREEAVVGYGASSDTPGQTPGA